ncbi:threonine/serine dehydratase [Streptomyces sp. NPDC096324]|uniref:threonine ammonia-lyase n=1 Tax=Streptomyces sp. NPDC096324 TaxID=3366085 RepID=UPI00381F0C17
MTVLTFNDIYAARQRLEPVIARTPLLAAPWASCGHRSLLLKPENLQVTGSFKIRGVCNFLLRLPDAQRARGVVVGSSGNHGRALAHAARQEGVKATVVLPSTTPEATIDSVTGQGAEVRLAPARDCALLAERLAEEHGHVLVPPFDDLDIIAGQATIGLEIAEEAVALGLDVATVLVPVGTGGLISGVAAALKLTRPGIKVVGVEPELAADAQESLHRGRRVSWPAERVGRTMADRLSTTTVGQLAFEHLRAFVDDIVTVTEDEIASSVTLLARHADMSVEPSAAVTAAAHLYHEHDLPAAGRQVAVISGRNIDPALLTRLREKPPLPFHNCTG